MCVIFGSVKMMFRRLLLGKEMKWCQKSSIRMFSKLWHYRIIWYLFAGFKTVILCSVHSIWFVKYVLAAKMWFVKTSFRIMKYESQDVKSNPKHCPKIYHTYSRMMKLGTAIPRESVIFVILGNAGKICILIHNF